MVLWLFFFLGPELIDGLFHCCTAIQLIVSITTLDRNRCNYWNSYKKRDRRRLHRRDVDGSDGYITGSLICIRIYGEMKISSGSFTIRKTRLRSPLLRNQQQTQKEQQHFLDSFQKLVALVFRNDIIRDNNKKITVKSILIWFKD